MAVAILDGVDAWPTIPPEYAPKQRGYLPGQIPELEPGYPQDNFGSEPKCSAGLMPSHGNHGHMQDELVADGSGKHKTWNKVVYKVMGFLDSLLYEDGVSG